ncbi:MAG TPA: Fe-S protein assembly co-chaperone HscB [Casimicrobiaceae bacterium]|jgi:molecular chaperone HscB|nr:Fe-S protein assembly co-chaperone HscB [Casimicrobiaceae bacterium]
MIDFTLNHFELFGLPATFQIDGGALEARYRDLARDVHPDRHAGDASEQRAAAQAAARVNEAYRMLKDPVERGRYLLALEGIDALAETDTALSRAFLERELERRERAADAQDAGDVAALEAMLGDIRHESRARESELAARLDARDLDGARNGVRELKFLQKVAADVDAMIEAIEA